MNFADRHIGPAAAQQRRMLDAIGYGSLDELTAAALPAQIATGRAAGPAPGAVRGGGPGRSCAAWPPATSRCAR